MDEILVTFQRLAVTAVIVVAVPVPASAAGPFNPMGDGSGADNQDLLAGGCENCVLTAPPREVDDPFFDLDWSLALRGAYVRNDDGEHYELLAIPSATLRHDTVRGGYAVTGSAEFSKPTESEYRLQSVELAFDGDYALDQVTELRGNLDLGLTQEAPKGSGGMAREPEIIAGGGEIAVDRRFGQFLVGARASARRTVYGPSRRADGSGQDNSTQNNWQAGGGLRLGYAVTPVLTAFVDGSVEHQFYDTASPIWSTRLDATDYEVRTGLAAQINATLEAEASVGLGLRRFVAPALGEVTTTLYDASLTFRPDETVTLEAAVATSIGAPGPDSAGSARIEYEATGSASYQVNPWLRLRSSVGWRQARLVGVTATENGYNFGAGLDYLLNRHTALTADYDFSHEQTTPDPGEDEQRVTLGITLSR